jgi:hypothetical protein
MFAKSSQLDSGSLTCSASRPRRRARRHAPNIDAPTPGAVACPAARSRRGAPGHHESIKIDTDIPIGKYTVCPLAKPQADGGFTATVSIGTGRGNAAHARVMRFAPLFETSEAALRYATSEGLNWARQQPAWSTSRALAARGAAGLSIA